MLLHGDGLRLRRTPAVCRVRLAAPACAPAGESGDAACPAGRPSSPGRGRPWKAVEGRPSSPGPPLAAPSAPAAPPVIPPNPPAEDYRAAEARVAEINRRFHTSPSRAEYWRGDGHSPDVPLPAAGVLLHCIDGWEMGCDAVGCDGRWKPKRASASTSLVSADTYFPRPHALPSLIAPCLS